MKTSTLTMMILAATVANTGVEQPKELSSGYEHKDLYACIVWPLCDMDNENHLLQPKDKKTETQDTKDEKLA
ncbi:hypothetical protein [Rheinheimera fenheensis]|uniref:hypothetical protein n=1 Tax=Rheinheimera fenheensis TaxID=3152295 RepID=UPI00325DB67B